MYSKYLDYSETAIKAQNINIAENQQKDTLINNLKSDLYQLRKLQADFLKLNDQITTLQDKYSLLLEQRQRTQKQQRTKSQIDKTTIIEFRQQIDHLRIQIQKVSNSIQQTIRQNTSLKRMSDARASQIQKIININRDWQGKNQRQNDQNKNISFNVKSLKQERKKIEDDCDQLSNQLDSNINKLKNIQKNLRNSQSNNARLDKTLLQAENDNLKLKNQLKEQVDEVSRNAKRLKEIGETIKELNINYESLQISCNKNKNDLQNNNRIWQNENNKGKQLVNKLRVVEQVINDKQNELDKMGKQEQKLRRQHFEKIDENKLLNSQIDRILSLISEYEQVNRQLIQQIQIYIDQDQQARSILNRKQNMRELINRTIAKVQQTNQPIKHLRY